MIGGVNACDAGFGFGERQRLVINRHPDGHDPRQSAQTRGHPFADHGAALGQGIADQQGIKLVFRAIEIHIGAGIMGHKQRRAKIRGQLKQFIHMKIFRAPQQQFIKARGPLEIIGIIAAAMGRCAQKRASLEGRANKAIRRRIKARGFRCHKGLGLVER